MMLANGESTRQTLVMHHDRIVIVSAGTTDIDQRCSVFGAASTGGAPILNSAGSQTVYLIEQ